MFLLDSDSRGFTPKTLDFYRHRLGLFLRYCDEQGAKTLADLTHTLIRAYLARQQQRQKRQEISSAYVHSHARAIRTFCYFLVREELLTDSPFAKLKMPRLETKVRPALTGDEVQAVLKVCDCERDKALVLFMLDTGIRASELCALDAGDLDHEGACFCQSESASLDHEKSRQLDG